MALNKSQTAILMILASLAGGGLTFISSQGYQYSCWLQDGNNNCILFDSNGGSTYLIDAKSQDLCSNYKIWEKTTIPLRYSCSSENSIKWCYKVSSTGRTCYLLEPTELPLVSNSCSGDIKNFIINDGDTYYVCEICEGMIDEASNCYVRGDKTNAKRLGDLV